jgi:hypothetical protein
MPTVATQVNRPNFTGCDPTAWLQPIAAAACRGSRSCDYASAHGVRGAIRELYSYNILSQRQSAPNLQSKNEINVFFTGRRRRDACAAELLDIHKMNVL